MGQTKKAQRYQAALLAALAGNPQGLYIEQLPLADRDFDAVTTRLKRLSQAGLVKWVHEPQPPKAWNRRRYYAAQFAPEVNGEASVKRTGTKGYTRKGRALSSKPARAYDRLDDRPVICNVAPTVCPSGRDHRFTVTNPTPYFSALAIGSYPPSDSWAAKVYGG